MLLLVWDWRLKRNEIRIWTTDNARSKERAMGLHWSLAGVHSGPELDSLSSFCRSIRSACLLVCKFESVREREVVRRPLLGEQGSGIPPQSIRSMRSPESLPGQQRQLVDSGACFVFFEMWISRGAFSPLTNQDTLCLH